jgi:hypothetical protein
LQNKPDASSPSKTLTCFDSEAARIYIRCRKSSAFRVVES